MKDNEFAEYLEDKISCSDRRGMTITTKASLTILGLFIIFGSTISISGANTMSEQVIKHAIRCEAELHLHFSNQKEEPLEYIFSDWGAEVPLYELLSPQSGAFSLCFWFEGYGSYLVSKIPIRDVSQFIEELKESINLKDGEEQFIKTASDQFTLAIERQRETAIVYNLHHKLAVDSSYDGFYHVPWCEYQKMVQDTYQEYHLLLQKVKNHAIKYFNESSQSDPCAGLVLWARVERKSPVLGEHLKIVMEIKNVSKDIKSLVNDFDIHVSDLGETISISVSGNPLKGLKKQPVILKPGESLNFTPEITIKKFAATIRTAYSADNDFSIYTNMVPASYLKHIGKHYDLSGCWQGEIKTEISLLVRPENINTVTAFEDWLKQKVAGSY